jgi:LysM repeat protein
MAFIGKWNLVGLVALLWVAGNGCTPPDAGPLDDEREPHYEQGLSKAKAMDYAGAVSAFEESLEVNPHSAPAHFQLAMLYENEEADPAAAIYHYQQYLKYDPKTEKADIIAQHITICKQQLGRDVLQLPSAPAAQQQIERLTEENRRLRELLSQWGTWYAMQLAAKTNPPAAPYNYATTAQTQPAGNAGAEGLAAPPPSVTNAAGTAVAGAGKPAATSPTNRAVASTRTVPRSAPVRTHVVIRGETMASIARKEGVSLNLLETANPKVNPKRIRAGQVLNLPLP